jgi:uncharacterized protein Yka (UPF0111/DUF47 family)
MTDEELKLLIASNARAIQAAADERAEMRLAIGRLEQTIDRLDQTVEKLTDLNEGVVKLVSSLDEDRPTVLRRLAAIENTVERIENKVDQLQSQGD